MKSYCAFSLIVSENYHQVKNSHEQRNHPEMNNIVFLKKNLSCK